MLTQIAYVRQQIAAAQRAGTPSARADYLQRAMEGLDHLEWRAALAESRQSRPWQEKIESADSFTPGDADALFAARRDEQWTVEDILAREG